MFDNPTRRSEAEATAAYDQIDAHFLETLRDPKNNAAWAEINRRADCHLAAEAAFQARMPGDADLVGIIATAVEICDRIEAHSRWHCEREEQRGLPDNSRASIALADFMYEASEMREALPDATDEVLAAMLHEVILSIRTVRNESDHVWLVIPGHDKPVMIAEELMPIAVDQFLELADGDLRDLTESLGGVLEALRVARVGFDLKLVDTAPLTFEEVPISTTAAHIRALEILAFSTPGHPAKNCNQTEAE